jgi:hypothetical protein
VCLCACCPPLLLPQFVDPYTFPSAHERLLEPYNYFAFGQRYVSTLIDFSNSFLGQAELWAKVGRVFWGGAGGRAAQGGWECGGGGGAGDVQGGQNWGCAVEGLQLWFCRWQGEGLWAMFSRASGGGHALWWV